MLIDADNVSAVHIAGVLTELAKFGTTSVRRMYGDWTSSNLSGWKKTVNEHSIQPIQQFAYTKGKNATDSALIIDAMDLLHEERFDAFAIVSSDSDFTRLAARIRESGVQVFGFGEHKKTPKPFVNACDTFTYFDVLYKELPEVTQPKKPTTGTSSKPSEAAPVKPPARKTMKQLRADSRLVNLLRKAIADCADDDGWANLSQVGSTVRKQAPDFDARNWGYARLGDLVTTVDLFESDKVTTQNGGTSLRFKIKK